MKPLSLALATVLFVLAAAPAVHAAPPAPAASQADAALSKRVGARLAGVLGAKRAALLQYTVERGVVRIGPRARSNEVVAPDMVLPPAAGVVAADMSQPGASAPARTPALVLTKSERDRVLAALRAVPGVVDVIGLDAVPQLRRPDAPTAEIVGEKG